MAKRLKINHLLVVGGTGFIGFHLIKKINKTNWNITSLSLKKPRSSRKVKGVNYVCADVSSASQLKRKLRNNYTHVVNVGGYSLYEYLNVKDGEKKLYNSHFLGLVNLLGVLNLKYIKKFIQIGTADEYGDIKAPQKESDAAKPINSYGKIKLLCTKYLIYLNKSLGFPVTILRFFLTYGPDQDKNRLIRQVIEACIKNKILKVSKGEAIRDFCYIEDAVKSILLCLTSSNTSGKILNVGSGKPIKVKKVVNIVRQKINKGKIKFGYRKYRPGEVMKQYPDLKKIKKLINWEPKTNLYIGIDKTIKFFKNC